MNNVTWWFPISDGATWYPIGGASISSTGLIKAEGTVDVAHFDGIQRKSTDSDLLSGKK